MREELERLMMELEEESSSDSGDAGTALVDAPEEAPSAPPIPRQLPPWRVLLHNDDFNAMEDVVEAILELTPLDHMEAIERMLEAHTQGVALIVTTHREHAELLQEQFISKSLVVSIEPD